MLIDFGAARGALGSETRTLTVMYTPGYAPIEQYQGSQGRQGAWTDIYGLAATFYGAVTGIDPLDVNLRIGARVEGRDDPMPLAAEIGRGFYSPELLSVIDAGLALMPDERPQSIDAWRAMLEDSSVTVDQSREPPEASAADSADTRVQASPSSVTRGQTQDRPEATAADAADTLIHSSQATTLGPRTGDEPKGPPWWRSSRWIYSIISLVVLVALWGGGTMAGWFPVFWTLPLETTAELPAVTNPKHKAGATFRDPLRGAGEGPLMVVIPAGGFAMGASVDDVEGHEDEGPQHSVKIKRSFAFGVREVTVGEFRQFVEATGYVADPPPDQPCGDGTRNWQVPGFDQSDDHPAVCLSWLDAQAYVRWLASRSGAPYHLPSEAQWEYAARGGTDTPRYWGDDPAKACENANVADAALKKKFPNWRAYACDDAQTYTAAAGRYQANGFGIFDALGNIWEWTQDCWHDGYKNAPADGSAWVEESCGVRVFRGGSWFNGPRSVRAAFRNSETTVFRSTLLGIRLARDL